MTNTGRTLIAASRFLASVVFVMWALLALAPRADASPFMLNLVTSGSSGGGGGGPVGGGGSISRGASLGGGSNFGLHLAAVAAPLSSAGGMKLTSQTKTDATTILLSSPAATSPAGSTTVASLVAAVKSSVGALVVSGSVAQLDLGNGESLSVSPAVAESLVRSVSEGGSSTGGGAGNAIDPSQSTTGAVLNEVTGGGGGVGPGSNHSIDKTIEDSINHGLPSSNSPAVQGSIAGAVPNEIVNVGIVGAVPNEIVNVGVADVVSGFISVPGGQGNADPALGAVGGAAEDAVSTSEPGTLFLVASALAITARRLRRQRT